MKKIIIAVFGVFIFSFLIPESVNASCNKDRDPTSNTCKNKTIDCAYYVPSGSTDCCDTISECPGYIPPPNIDCKKSCPAGYTPGVFTFADRCCKLLVDCNTDYKPIDWSCTDPKLTPVVSSDKKSCKCQLEKPGCDQCGKCEGKPVPAHWTTCNDCLTGKTLGGNPGAWTALGCISTDPGGFINWLLPKAIGVAGGIAFLLILMGGFQILTSSGEPEKLNEGKDIVVYAIVGLLMIIFSIILLRIIGYDILQIPGFMK